MLVTNLAIKMESRETGPLDALGAVLKKNIESIPIDDFRMALNSHLKQLKLLNHDGDWAHPKLEEIENQIVPQTIVHEVFTSLLDEMIRLMYRNQYLLPLFNNFNQADLTKTIEHFNKDSDWVMAHLMSYALLMENLTKAQYNDWRILEVCHEVWIKEQIASDIRKHMKWFDKLKMDGIKKPIDSFIRFHKTGKVDKNFFRMGMPLNVLMAVAKDMTLGNKGNAKAGWFLAKQNTYQNHVSVTNGQYAQISPDGKALEIIMPNQPHWIDFYLSWNLAFCAHFHRFPWVMIKLLVPQVTNYQDKPHEFLYNRIMALYTTLNYTYFMRADDMNQYDNLLNWQDPILLKLWNDNNSDAIKSYIDRYKKAK